MDTNKEQQYICIAKKSLDKTEIVIPKLKLVYQWRDKMVEKEITKILVDTGYNNTLNIDNNTYTYFLEQSTAIGFNKQVDGFKYDCKMANNALAKMAKIEGYIHVFVYIPEQNIYEKAGILPTIYCIEKSEPMLGLMGLELMKFHFSKDLTRLYYDKSFKEESSVGFVLEQ